MSEGGSNFSFLFKILLNSELPDPLIIIWWVEKVLISIGEPSLGKIIDEEITKVEKVGFGSYRGFQTFVIGPLEESIMKRAIQEIWCVVIIKKNMNKLTKKWIEKRFAPGGKGYLEAKERFENNDYTIS